MKFLTIPLLAVALLTGCATSPKNNPVVTATVAAIAGIGIQQYPHAIAEVRIAENVICAASSSTNLEPAKIVADLQSAGVTDPNAKLIVNGCVAIYDVLFASYGADWVRNRPELQGYLAAICDGLTQALPRPTLPVRRNPLPPHLK